MKFYRSPFTMSTFYTLILYFNSIITYFLKTHFIFMSFYCRIIVSEFETILTIIKTKEKKK